MHQIASVLGLTESRVSQIRSRAIARLRNVMTPVRDGAAGDADTFPIPLPVATPAPRRRSASPAHGYRQVAP